MIAPAGVGILSIFLLFGGASLPLGLPPLPEDAAISRAAPEKCLAYFSWSGSAAPDAKSTNQTEQLLGEPEVQKMVAAIDAAITAGLKKDAERGKRDAEPGLDIYRLAKLALTRPAAIFVEKVDLSAGRPKFQAGAIISLGDKADDVAKTLEHYEKLAPPDVVEKTTIEGMTVHRLKDPQLGDIYWGVRDGYLITGIGTGSVEGILSRLKGEPPAWLAAIHKQLPVNRVSTVTYIDVKQALAQFLPLGPPQAKNIVDALGFGNVQSYASVTGLDENAFVARTLVRIDGEPEGILRLAAAKPLAAADLAPIPRDATIAVAGRLDATAAMQNFLEQLGKVDPDARKEFQAGLGKANEQLGIDVEEDLLKSLGDVWCVYNSPSEGGLLVTGLTGVVQVKDHDRFETAMNKLIMTFHDQVEVPALRVMGSNPYGYRSTPRIVKSTFAGRTIYHFDISLREFPPIAPAWCLTDKELIVSTFPEHIKAYLSRPKGQPSIADVPEVAAALKESGAVALGYCDTRKVAEYFYPFACIGGQAMADDLRRGGPEIDISGIIPSATAILPHLQPSLSFVRRTGDGIEIVRHGPIGGPASLNLLSAAMFMGFTVRAPMRMEPQIQEESAPARPITAPPQDESSDVPRTEPPIERDLAVRAVEKTETSRTDSPAAAKRIDGAEVIGPSKTESPKELVVPRQPQKVIEQKAKELAHR